MNLKSEQTIITLANATALVAGIVQRVSGNEVAASLNGQAVTRATLASLIANRIYVNLLHPTGRK